MKYDIKYYEFLDGLRESGVTNMLGAGWYLEQQFPEINEKKSREILINWMATFHERKQKGGEKA